MNLSIGYLPISYYDFTPDAGGCFPFAVDIEVPYVVSFCDIYLPECDENFVPSWMENIKAYPLYFCAEVPNYFKDEYEEILSAAQIEYRYLTEGKEQHISVARIQHGKQLLAAFPFYITLGCGGETVVWGTKEDVFSVELRKWKGNWDGLIEKTIVIKPKVDTSIFWIGYDGNSIDVLSGQRCFSTYENIIKTLPEFVTPSLCEFE
ncbi:hypothetical protein AB1K89_11955 [Sporosarcina sp. 179-K 8C2 HS]|uniref:hypothetical protein n=1 Tax=Sporosarcina sp. 179-K 8C2 HS TaxID=3142387 RepID=UPI00399F322F